jgi:hypothetical protein
MNIPDPLDFLKNPGLQPLNAQEIILNLYEKQLLYVKAYFGDRAVPALTRLHTGTFSPVLREAFKLGAIHDLIEIVVVPCGAQSGGLCALISLADDHSAQDKILQLHPSLAAAATTRWRDFLIRWVTIAGWLPPSCALDGGWWITDGLVPVTDTRLPSAGQTFPMPPGQAIPTLGFDDLKWPAAVRNSFLLQRTQDLFGGILYAAQAGEVELSHRAVTYYIHQRDRYIFDGRSGGFTYWPSNLQVRTKVSEADLRLTILETLHQITAGNRTQFPVSKIKSADGQAVVELLRLACAKDSGNEQEALVRFIEERIESRVGAAVTTKEMYRGYAHYCRSNDLPLYPEKWFLKEIPSLIRQRFAVLKSHCVKRATPDGGRVTDRNGFYGLTMKGEQDAKDGSGAKGGTDVQDGAVESAKVPHREEATSKA